MLVLHINMTVPLTESEMLELPQRICSELTSAPQETQLPLVRDGQGNPGREGAPKSAATTQLPGKLQLCRYRRAIAVRLLLLV